MTSHADPDSTWLPLAIAEIVDEDEQLLSQLEGLLVLAGGRAEHVVPKKVAQRSDLSVSAVIDVFRQLSQTGAVERESFGTSVGDSSYSIAVDECRQVFETARTAARSIAAYRDRQPPATTAIPLVTFPADPAFQDLTPSSFGMSWLMPALTRQIKRATSEIVLLAPFFEVDGFAHLEEVLFAAIDRGVSVTIVSRYLRDSNSYNHDVLQAFAEEGRARDIDLSELQFIDYTKWKPGTPPEKQRQDGDTPAFTLHAKIIVFDESAVYIGSANVTDYGFEHYLETGVLLEGPPAGAFSDLVTHLLTSDAATEVALLG